MSEVRIISMLVEQCWWNCVDCSSDSSYSKTGILDAGQLKEILSYFTDSEAKEGGTRAEHLVSGGEPTLHLDLRGVLEHSLDEDFLTDVTTNMQWVAVGNPSGTREYFEETFPERVVLRCSYNFELLSQDSDLLKKLILVRDMADGRNPVKAEVKYNGNEGKEKIIAALNEHGLEYYLVPKQQMGRGRFTPNLNSVEDMQCPKGKEGSFFVTPFGTYFCLRSGCNGISGLLLSRGNVPEEIERNLKKFNIHKISSGIKGFSPEKYHHACDICEQNQVYLAR